MKDVRFRINHPIHGELDAHVSLHPKTGATIHEYGHGGETVNQEDAHGDHEGGINEHMQSQIKAHAMKLGAGDHREKAPALDLQKDEGEDDMMMSEKDGWEKTQAYKEQGGGSVSTHEHPVHGSVWMYRHKPGASATYSAYPHKNAQRETDRDKKTTHATLAEAKRHLEGLSKMKKSEVEEKSPREVAIALLSKLEQLAKGEVKKAAMDDTSDAGEDQEVDEIHEKDKDPEADDKKPKEQSKDNLEKAERSNLTKSKELVAFVLNRRKKQ